MIADCRTACSPTSSIVWCSQSGRTLPTLQQKHRAIHWRRPLAVKWRRAAARLQLCLLGRCRQTAVAALSSRPGASQHRTRICRLCVSSMRARTKLARTTLIRLRSRGKRAITRRPRAPTRLCSIRRRWKGVQPSGAVCSKPVAMELRLTNARGRGRGAHSRTYSAKLASL